MRRTYSYVLLVLLIGLLIVGCGTKDNESQQASEVDQDDSTLTIAIENDIISQDTHDHNSIFTEAIHINMYNYLFKRDPATGEILPDLVESYENVDDKTWAFVLKEGVKFHHGEEMTAEDVKFTLERVS